MQPKPKVSVRHDPVLIVRQMLRSEGYVASDLLAAQIYLLLGDGADDRHIPALCLEGAPGTGKSSLAAAFARIRAKLNCGPGCFIKISVYGSTTVEDVMYGSELRTLERIGMGQEENDRLDMVSLNNLGALPLAFKLAEELPVTLMVDEFDKLSSCSPTNPNEPSAVEGWLLCVLGDGTLPVRGQKPMIAVRRNLSVFIGKNYRRDLSAELRRRARVARVDFPSPDVEIPLLAGRTLKGRGLSCHKLDVQPISKLPLGLSRFLVEKIAAKVRANSRHLTLVPSTEVLGNIGRDAMRLAAAGHPELIEPVITRWLLTREEELSDLRSVLPQEVLSEQLIAAVTAGKTSR